jgi:hypothetical protein
VLFESGADGVDVMLDAAQIGVIGEESADHRRRDPELVGVPAQRAGSVCAGGDERDDRERGQDGDGDQEIQQNSHGSNYLSNNIPPTVAELTI